MAARKRKYIVFEDRSFPGSVHYHAHAGDLGPLRLHEKVLGLMMEGDMLRDRLRIDNYVKLFVKSFELLQQSQ